MQVAIDTRTDMENALRQALSRNELQLHFQPQVDENRRIIGTEALLRWLRLDVLPVRGGAMRYPCLATFGDWTTMQDGQEVV